MPKPTRDELMQSLLGLLDYEADELDHEIEAIANHDVRDVVNNRVGSIRYLISRLVLLARIPS